MQHLILILPLAGIAVFWFLPLGIAIPVYITILVISGALYWMLYRIMRKQPETGNEGLIGARTRVVSVSSTDVDARYVVQIEGELWKASSPDELQTGDLVTITGVDRLTLKIKKTTPR